MYQFSRLLSLHGWLALAVTLVAIPVAVASPPPTMHDLVRADKATLDSLFAAGTVGPVPTGYLHGRAIVSPGSRRTVPESRLLRPLWQGKVFHDDGTGKNHVFGVSAVPVKIYEGQSWRDGGPAIIVDYGESWRVFRGVRDEIREVSPGLYLGLTYKGKEPDAEPAMMFTLQAPK
jgi:hypothetical protein